MISVVVITLNEKDNLPRCLRSVDDFEEKVVLDSGSTDGTSELASQMGCRVYVEPWQGFGPQKRRAVDLASQDWVLCLDADEELTPELRGEIVGLNLDPNCIYALPRRSFHLGKWIGHGGWRPDYQLRLFNRKYFNWNSSVIHEKVEAIAKGGSASPSVDGTAGNRATPDTHDQAVTHVQIIRLKNPLNHFVFRDLSHQITTNNRYSGLLAEQDFGRGERFSLVRLLVKPMSKFLECYVIKLGFLDGFAGLVIAVLASQSIFWRQVKLRELERR